MTKNKRFKDPIYGYIDIDENIISSIVDTAGFQRLRNIIQTSYSPLYSSAVHNRFVHSLGVYHLGRIVSESIVRNKNEFIEIGEIERYLKIFELACLLHDLGHAPFSHTGEDFYLENGKRNLLHNVIIELTGDEDLEEEIERKNYKAAPHELMSVIVALREYGFLFQNDAEKSFFARCIIGYPYAKREEIKNSFLNCIISLLNSTVIDVDKLDYLIRDAYITGFDTVSIDYVRLLQSISLRKEEQKYQIVYKKGAISVIENVVYAHDAERKWIQNHPIVQYEAYLLQSSIEALKNKYTNVDLFSYEALTEDGIEVFENYRISLLCDADITFLMKNLNNDSAKEYFRRKDRRHPLWKSEAEYKAIFNVGYTDTIFEIVENALEGLCKYLNFVCQSQEINKAALDACKRDMENAQRLLETAETNKEKLEALIVEKGKHLQWLEALETFANEQKIDFDFVILKANQFNSGFAKEAFAKIQIEFDSLSKPCFFEKVTNTLKAEKSARDKFFYLFYRRINKENKINLRRLAVILGKIALQEVFDD